jgi:NTP pyrophosphatase (non-canonical NTP hydrolase)
MTEARLLEVDALVTALEKFAADRDWQPFHTPRNLVLALTGEVGELAEIFQWLSEDEASNLQQNPQRYTHLQEEIADVLLYLVRLAAVMKIDLNHAVCDKMAKNALKYPPSHS